MSEALRSVFAEFGFHIDAGALKALDERVKASTKGMDALPKAAAKTSKATNAVQELNVAELKQQMAVAAKAGTQQAWAQKKLDDAKAHVEAMKKEKAAADALAQKLSTYGGILDHLDGKFHKTFGAGLVGRFKSLDLLAKKWGLTSEGVGRVVVGASAAAVGALAGATRAAFAFAAAFAADAEALRDTARESRVTTTELQELDHAAVQSGVGVERMRSGVATFGASLRSAERWGNGTTGMLRRLGIQSRDSAGRIRPTADLMGEVATAMDHVHSPTRRARIAVQLFGESGRRMLDVLHGGAGGLRELQESFAELGGGVTPEAIAASRVFTMQTGRLKIALDSLRSVLAVALLPALSWLVQKGASVAGLFARLTNGTHLVQIALIALGVVGAAVAAALIAAWLPAAAPYLAVAAAVGAAALVFDDLWTFVEGGDSAIGRFLDTIADDEGFSARWATSMREDWRELVHFMERAAALLQRINAFVGPAAIRAAISNITDLAPGGKERAGARATEAARVANQLDGAETNYSDVRSGGPDTIARRTRAVTAPPIPGVRAVTAPGVQVGARTIVRQNTSAPVMHFHGVTDANIIAGKVRETLRSEEQNRRDADHPVEDDDS